jgi:integrase
VSTIQRQLGHASLSVTTRYLAGLGEEEHLDRVRKVEW